MAFSKGKRIEDETSKRIVDLAVNIGCKEGMSALTVTRLCRDAPYYDRFMARIMAVFTYIYEKNASFQYYTALYEVSEGGVKNELLQDLESMVEEGKAQGVVNAATDSRRAAETLWLIVTSISRMLAGNTGYPYHDARDTMLYGVQAVFETMKIR